MTWYGRQPAFWLGLIATLVVGIVQTLAGQGVISEAASGKVVDVTQAAVNLLTLIAPLLAGLAIHTQVTPTAAPVLSVGTPVTTPQGAAAFVMGTIPTLGVNAAAAAANAPAVPPKA
jgi:hypothetical protein